MTLPVLTPQEPTGDSGAGKFFAEIIILTGQVPIAVGVPRGVPRTQNLLQFGLFQAQKFLDTASTGPAQSQILAHCIAGYRQIPDNKLNGFTLLVQA